LKFSTLLDWAVMFGTGFLILLALLLLIFVRRSKPFYFVIALAANSSVWRIVEYLSEVSVH
jgi:hypothetical protein